MRAPQELDAPGLRVVLDRLDLVRRDNVGKLIEDDETRRGCADVERSEEICRRRREECSRIDRGPGEGVRRRTAKSREVEGVRLRTRARKDGKE